MALQLEGHLRETLEHVKLGDLTSDVGNSVGNSNHLEAQIQQLLSASSMQTSRLAKLESSCLSSRNTGQGFGMNGKNGFQLQEVTPREAALDGVLAALQAVKAELDKELRSTRQRHLPAGKPSILLPVCLLRCVVSFSLWSFNIQQPPGMFLFLSVVTHLGNTTLARTHFCL